MMQPLYSKFRNTLAAALVIGSLGTADLYAKQTRLEERVGDPASDTRPVPVHYDTLRSRGIYLAPNYSPTPTSEARPAPKGESRTTYMLR